MTGQVGELVEVEREVSVAAHSWLAQAQALEVTDHPSAQAAAALLTEQIAPRKAAVEAFFAPLVSAAHQAHKALTTRRAAVLEQFTEPERVLKTKLATYAEERRDQEAAAGLLHAESQRLAGVQIVEEVTVEVTDMRLLAAAVAEGSAPVTVIEPNMRELKQRAVALGAAFVLPGVKVGKRLSARRTGR